MDVTCECSPPFLTYFGRSINIPNDNPRVAGILFLIIFAIVLFVLWALYHLYKIGKKGACSPRGLRGYVWTCMGCRRLARTRCCRRRRCTVACRCAACCPKCCGCDAPALDGVDRPRMAVEVGAGADLGVALSVVADAAGAIEVAVPDAALSVAKRSLGAVVKVTADLGGLPDGYVVSGAIETGIEGRLLLKAKLTGARAELLLHVVTVDSRDVLRETLREMAGLRAIVSPYVLAVNDAFPWVSVDGSLRACMVTPLPAYGTLASLKFGSLNEQAVMTILAQLCQGLRALHELRVSVGGINANSVLLTASGGVMIGVGLGLVVPGESDEHSSDEESSQKNSSSEESSDDKKKRSNKKRSVKKPSRKGANVSAGGDLYRAPEARVSKKKQERFRPKEDVWSLGCLFYQLCCDSADEDLTSIAELVETADRDMLQVIGRVSSNLSDEVRRIVLLILDLSPVTRPSAETLCCDAYISAWIVVNDIASRPWLNPDINRRVPAGAMASLAMLIEGISVTDLPESVRDAAFAAVCSLMVYGEVAIQETRAESLASRLSAFVRFAASRDMQPDGVLALGALASLTKFYPPAAITFVGEGVDGLSFLKPLLDADVDEAVLGLVLTVLRRCLNQEGYGATTAVQNRVVEKGVLDALASLVKSSLPQSLRTAALDCARLCIENVPSQLAQVASAGGCSFPVTQHATHRQRMLVCHTCTTQLRVAGGVSKGGKQAGSTAKGKNGSAKGKKVEGSSAAGSDYAEYSGDEARGKTKLSSLPQNWAALGRVTICQGCAQTSHAGHELGPDGCCVDEAFCMCGAGELPAPCEAPAASFTVAVNPLTIKHKAVAGLLKHVSGDLDGLEGEEALACALHFIRVAVVDESNKAAFTKGNGASKVEKVAPESGDAAAWAAQILGVQGGSGEASDSYA